MSGLGAERRAHAPGRVNLIGDHTDYNAGLALPMALRMGVEARFRPDGSELLSIRTDLDPQPVEIGLNGTATAVPRWARLTQVLIREVGPSSGGRIEVRSDLPVGVGLSSSAALGVALALVLGAPPEPVAIARLCQRAESVIGVPVGLMDPLVAMQAQAGYAALIDFESLETTQVPVPEDAEFTIVDPGSPRLLDASPYAERRAQCEAAAALLGRPLGRCSGGDVVRLDDPLLVRRARHVVSEVERVRSFASSLGTGDLEAAGALMTESHASLRDDFEVSTPLLDRMVEDLGARPGVLGARVTGAGFGGCIVVLARPGTVIEAGVRTWRAVPSRGASVRIG
ncbi:MAG: galactokinase [Acidimicrobiales bacterium]